MNGFPQGEDLSFGEEGKHLLDEVGSDTFDLSFNLGEPFLKLLFSSTRRG